ncbi:MAG: glycoside hydrolase family 172 protein [Caldilineaceae bacterium]
MFSSQSFFTMPKGIQTRWASPENWEGEKGVAAQSNGGRKGSAWFALKAGEQRTLAEVSGSSGMIRRIWATIRDRSPQMLRSIRLDIYWDGASTPAVSVPLGDFFGHAAGRCVAFESALLSSPEGRSFNCCIPMPFRSSMKMVVTNESATDLTNFFYDVDYTIGDEHGDEMLYFHACWQRQNPTRHQIDYEVLPRVKGRGRFLGMSVGVIADMGRYADSWWGEGEVKIYLDGDGDFPTLAGTGVEDYVGNGWAGNTNVTYAHAYQGFPLNDIEHGIFAFYRFHIPDPIYFHSDIRVTVQQIGAAWVKEWVDGMRELGETIYDTSMMPIDLHQHETIGPFEREDDWSSCAYFYLDRAENGLPGLVGVEARV